MTVATYHLRRSTAGMHLSHYVDSRTIVSLCGVSALDWPLVLEGKTTPDCEKCRKMLDNVKVES